MANGALVGLYVASIIFLIMGIAGLYGIFHIIKDLLKRANFCYLYLLLEHSSLFLFLLQELSCSFWRQKLSSMDHVKIQKLHGLPIYLKWILVLKIFFVKLVNVTLLIQIMLILFKNKVILTILLQQVVLYKFKNVMNFKNKISPQQIFSSWQLYKHSSNVEDGVTIIIKFSIFIVIYHLDQNQLKVVIVQSKAFLIKMVSYLELDVPQLWHLPYLIWLWYVAFVSIHLKQEIDLISIKEW